MWVTPRHHFCVWGIAFALSPEFRSNHIVWQCAAPPSPLSSYTARRVDALLLLFEPILLRAGSYTLALSATGLWCYIRLTNSTKKVRIPLLSERLGELALPSCDLIKRFSAANYPGS